MLTGPDLACLMVVHNGGLESVPIVLCSGRADLAVIALRVGTPYVVAKPYTLERFLIELTRALAERTAPRPAPR